MMTTIQLYRDNTDQGSTVIGAFSSITDHQAGIIAQTAQAANELWEVHTSEDYDGYLSILVERTIYVDQQKAFFISGTAAHLELFEVCDDNMMPIATFNNADDLSEILLSLISPFMPTAQDGQ